MPDYKVRNKRRQIAAEVSEKGLSVHEQRLSWELQRLRESGEPPFTKGDTSLEGASHMDDLLRFFAENGYTVELENAVARP